jgi:hypothetical protein
MRPGRPLPPEVSIAPSWRPPPLCADMIHVAGRRAGRQRPAERAERRLDERVRVEVAERHAVLALGVLRLDAAREEGDDPRARVGGREGVDLLVDLVVVDVGGLSPRPRSALPMPWKCTSRATSRAGQPFSEFGTIAIARPLAPAPVPAVSATSLHVPARPPARPVAAGARHALLPASRRAADISMRVGSGGEPTARRPTALTGSWCSA